MMGHPHREGRGLRTGIRHAPSKTAQHPHRHTMIVPDYWAQARRQHRASGRQITVRRYGWSLLSAADAQAHAETRAEDALRRILAGENLHRSEPKMAYNGADGVPIREEVLARHGEQVITRNAYGAHCLNSPNTLFADIDFQHDCPARASLLAFAVLALAAAAAGLWWQRWGVFFGLLLPALLLASPLAHGLMRLVVAARGGAEHLARQRLLGFMANHPAWGVRLYRTPAGYRLLVTHQPFDAGAAEVQHFFAAVAADPIYTRMCLNQRCFRARLTAKPWRIGIAAHMRPRPGVWPVHPQRMATRQAWITHYENRAAAFAACRYLETLGSAVVHAAVQPVLELHDRASRAHQTDLALA